MTRWWQSLQTHSVAMEHVSLFHAGDVLRVCNCVSFLQTTLHIDINWAAGVPQQVSLGKATATLHSDIHDTFTEEWKFVHMEYHPAKLPRRHVLHDAAAFLSLSCLNCLLPTPVAGSPVIICQRICHSPSANIQSPSLSHSC